MTNKRPSCSWCSRDHRKIEGRHQWRLGEAYALLNSGCSVVYWKWVYVLHVLCCMQFSSLCCMPKYPFQVLNVKSTLGILRHAKMQVNTSNATLYVMVWICEWIIYMWMDMKGMVIHECISVWEYSACVSVSVQQWICQNSAWMLNSLYLWIQWIVCEIYGCLGHVYLVI